MKIQLIRNVKEIVGDNVSYMTIENTINNFLKNFNVDEAVHRIGIDSIELYSVFESVLEEEFF